MNDYKYNIIHPKLEVARYKIMTKIFNKFFKILQKYNPNINREKSDTIITLFCWKNLTNIDPVIPYQKKYNYDQLIIDLSTYKFNPDIIIKKLKIEKLLSKYIKKFDSFYNSIDLHKKINVINNNNTFIYKNKFIVESNQIIVDKLNKHFDLTIEKLKVMKKQYSSDEYFDNINKNVLFFCILYRYKLMSAGNQQLSVLTSFKEDLKNKFSVKTELFGSCLNRYFDNYCSLFYDLEKYFGSLGNFFNQTFTEGLYFANPPFDEDIMENMAEKILSSLDNTNKPLGFIITVPVWDTATQQKIATKCNNLNSIIKIQNSKNSELMITKKSKDFLPIDTTKYKCADLIKSSKYLYKEYTFCKKDFPYYSFAQNRIINASNTYIFIVKNSQLSFNLQLFESILYNNKLYHIKE